MSCMARSCALCYCIIVIIRLLIIVLLASLSSMQLHSFARCARQLLGVRSPLMFFLHICTARGNDGDSRTQPVWQGQGQCDEGRAWGRRPHGFRGGAQRRCAVRCSSLACVGRFLWTCCWLALSRRRSCKETTARSSPRVRPLPWRGWPSHTLCFLQTPAKTRCTTCPRPLWAPDAPLVSF